jgi:hypothetical protein
VPQLPRSIWLIVIGVVLSLLGLCAIAAYLVLRARARQRIAMWPATWILGLVAAAVVPWLVVRLFTIRIEVKINGILQMLGWSVLALGAFALLVILPIVAVASAGVWATARHRARKRDS